MFNFQNILSTNYDECVNIRSCHGSLLTLDVHNSVGYVRIDGIKPVVHVFMGVTNAYHIIRKQIVIFKKVTTFFNFEDMFRCYKHHRQLQNS